MTSEPGREITMTAISTILIAVRQMNPSPVVAVLDDAADRCGLDLTVDEIVFPALRVVGSFWSGGTLDVAHEHLLSSAVTRWVHGQLGRQQARRDGRILLAGGPQDLHVLGLDCLELLLASRGVQAVNLGGQVPVESLVLAATELPAAAVVVCSHSSTVTAQAVRAVKTVSAAGFPVYYAGSSFVSAFVRRHIPGDALDAPLSVTADLLTALHTVAAPQAGTGSGRADARLTA
jgi:hypothetical protein